MLPFLTNGKPSYPTAKSQWGEWFQELMEELFKPSRMAYFLGSAALYILFFKLWKKYTSPIKDGGTAKRQQVLTFLAERENSKSVWNRVTSLIDFSQQFNEYELYIMSDIVLPQDVDAGFEDIGGLEEIKESIYESIILPLHLPDSCRNSKLMNVPQGILLYGPPGTGKSMLAKAIAKSNNSVFIYANPAALQQHFYGQSEKVIEALFSLANKVQPCIIFIDEIDTLLGSRKKIRNEHAGHLLGMFLSLWDGMHSRKDNKITLIGATNRPDELDEAIHRRMQLSLYVGMPNVEGREKILRIILKDEPIAEDFDFRALAEATEGYSGSDLFSLCQKASRSPLREIINKYRHHPEPYKSIPLDEVPRRLTLQDFLMAKNTYGRTQDVVRDYRASRGEDSSSVGTLSLRPDNSLVNLMMLSPILFALGLGVAMRTPLQNTQSNSNVNMNLQ